ncbi:MAG TPA: hypothetical protein VM008_18255 [Phycisphaerae bacterium]|nr:hypothetical protein [Phycisphaerae bacterium]
MKIENGKPKIENRPRAFLVMDVLCGITLATILLMVLTAAVVKQNKAQRQLAQHRTASRTAEAALLALQSGQPLPQNAGIKLEKLPTPAPAGRTWIRLTLTEQNASAQLVGLVNVTATSGGIH